jgi:WD40 repeat protein
VAATLPHPAPITAMSMRPGPRLVTAADGVVRVWNQGRIEAAFTGYTGPIREVGIDGDDVYVSVDTPAVLVVDALGAPSRRKVYGAGGKTLINVSFDRELGRISAVSWDQNLYIWDISSGALRHKLEGTGPLAGVQTSPDGSIMVGLGGISPAVWNRRTGAQIGRLEGHTDLVRAGAFLSDQLFVSMAGNHTVLVWDVAARRPLVAFHDVEALAFPDDRRNVALIGPTGVRLWSPIAPVPEPFTTGDG